MKLFKVNFHAFRSLLNKEFIIKTNCIGIVGINESGKSNILDAMNVLNGDRDLLKSDTPKMARDNNPYVSYVFQLEEKEKNMLIDLINGWRDKNTIITDEILPSEFTISYHVCLTDQKEEKWFEIDNLKFNKKYLFLKFDRLNSFLPVKYAKDFISIDKAIIISNEILKENQIAEKLSFQLNELTDSINECTAELNKLQKENLNENKQQEPSENQPVTTDTNLVSDDVINKDQIPASGELKTQILKKEKELAQFSHQKEEIVKRLNGYDQNKKYNEVTKAIENLESKINGINAALIPINDEIATLEQNQSPEEEQKKRIAALKKQRITQESLLKKLENEKLKAQNTLSIIQEPFENNYSEDVSELNKHLESLLGKALIGLLPTVVFWKYDSNYLLQSETLLSDILSKNDLFEIPRPLVNTLRIGLGITTIEDLKSVIKEIQDVPEERSRLEKKLTKRINEFLKNVWSDYDQDIQISLEKERIRVEIFDPKYEDASYYSMLERSQGFQNFVSFLLTIGAEALHGVIKNTILLLDEPETHLHPSGVRFMLRELIRISENDNHVIFATHSIFMIDRDNFDRHVILNKDKEQTIIIPACIDRIGYFMQEEVLYNTLDVDLNKEFNSTNLYNFVFEGKGDAILFEYFYDKILTKSNRPFDVNNCSFYHGGKCSDIIKYFKSKPIQLGTKWIFILDSDKPASDVVKFLSSKYKAYLNKDIFIFQYVIDKKNNPELEDILPSDLIIETLNVTFQKKEILNVNDAMIDKEVNSELVFSDYSKNLFPDELHDELKTIFKEILNDNILKKLTKLNKKDFESSFSLYYKWANEKIGEISSSKN